MANNTCLSVLKLAAIRTGLLDDAGVPDPGSANLYSAKGILFGFTPQFPNRESFEQVDGEGDTCAKFTGPPKAPDSVDLTMNLCTLDAELIQMLTGGTTVTESYNTTGYLAPTDDTVNSNGVFIEAWAYAWSGRQRALVGSAPGFWRFAFPKTTWEQGQIQLENGISVIPLTGVAEPNSGFATGISSDPFPTDIGESVYGYVLTDSVPTVQCGAQALPA